MLKFIAHFFLGWFASKHALAMEVAALKQQLHVYQRQNQKRLKLRLADKLTWLILRAWKSNWKDLLFIVRPENHRNWDSRPQRCKKIG